MSQSKAVALDTSLEPFNNGTPLDYIEQDGQILFTADEIGQHLGYANPSHAINKLFRQNQAELKHYSVETKTVATDGKQYVTRAFSEEGVYILSMLARTNEAKRFRARVALLLRRVRREREERMMELARESGYKLGVENGAADGYSIGRQEGVDAVLGLTPMQYGVALKAMRYNAMGLSYPEIAKLIGASKDTIGRALRKLGVSL